MSRTLLLDRRRILDRIAGLILRRLGSRRRHAEDLLKVFVRWVGQSKSKIEVLRQELPSD